MLQSRIADLINSQSSKQQNYFQQTNTHTHTKHTLRFRFISAANLHISDSRGDIARENDDVEDPAPHVWQNKNAARAFKGHLHDSRLRRNFNTRAGHSRIELVR